MINNLEILVFRDLTIQHSYLLNNIQDFYVEVISQYLTMSQIYGKKEAYEASLESINGAFEELEEMYKNRD